MNPHLREKARRGVRRRPGLTAAVRGPILPPPSRVGVLHSLVLGHEGWAQWCRRCGHSGDGDPESVSVNRLNFASLTIGLVGLLFAGLSHWQSIEHRELVVDHSHPESVVRRDHAELGLRVIDGGGQLVEGQVLTSRVCVWNQGRASVRPEDILSPVRVSIADAKVLDARIVSASRRHITKPSLTLSQHIGSDSNPLSLPSGTPYLELNFSILEQSDGVSFEVAYSTSGEHTFYFTGDVEGRRPIRSPGVSVGAVAVGVVAYAILLVFSWSLARRLQVGATTHPTTLVVIMTQLAVAGIGLFLVIDSFTGKAPGALEQLLDEPIAAVDSSSSTKPVAD